MQILEGSELRLYGPVGYHEGADGFTSSDVVDALAEIGPDVDITVRINSGGGYAYEGVAIHTALAKHGGRVVVSVDGVAASAASLIAMAGDSIVMATGSLMMIHDPSLVTIGTGEEHRRSIEQLRATAAAMASIYSKRTGQSLATVRADMAAETWMTADEAVAARYADRAGTAHAKAAARFDYSVYAHVPLTALAAMAEKARSESPEALAAKPGWAKAATRLNASLAVTPDEPPAAPPAAREGGLVSDQSDAEQWRETAITIAARGKGAEALGRHLINTGTPLPVALGIIGAVPR